MKGINPTPRGLNLILWAGCGTFIAGLAGFIYSGFFTRYLADDYCDAVYIISHSFWQGQVAAWLTLSGRFMVTFMADLTELFGPFAIRLVPAFTFILWALGMGLFFMRARRLLPFKVPAAGAWLCGLLLVLSSLAGSPARVQTLYWRDGMFTYTFPMVYFSFLLVCGVVQLERQRPAWSLWLSIAGCAIFGFLASGLTETFSAFEISFFLIAAVGFIVWSRGWLRRRALYLLAASLLGSLAALILIAISPTTHARQAFFPPPPDIATMLRLSMSYAQDFMVYTTFQKKIVTAMTAGIPAVMMFYLGSASFPRRKWWQWLLLLALTVLAGYGLMVAICAPSAYGESAYPENRVLMIGRFDTVVTLMALGGISGLALRAWLERLVQLRPAVFNAAALTVLALCCAYAVVISYQINSKDIPYRQAWAAAWDQRDAQLRAAAARGETSVTVTALDSLEILYELGPDPQHWVNVCAAGYYHLKQIIAYPP